MRCLNFNDLRPARVPRCDRESPGRAKRLIFFPRRPEIFAFTVAVESVIGRIRSAEFGWSLSTGTVATISATSLPTPRWPRFTGVGKAPGDLRLFLSRIVIRGGTTTTTTTAAHRCTSQSIAGWRTISRAAIKPKISKAAKCNAAHKSQS